MHGQSVNLLKCKPRYVVYSHLLCRMHFDQNASSAILGCQGDGKCCLTQEKQHPSLRGSSWKLNRKKIPDKAAVALNMGTFQAVCEMPAENPLPAFHNRYIVACHAEEATTSLPDLIRQTEGESATTELSTHL